MPNFANITLHETDTRPIYILATDIMADKLRFTPFYPVATRKKSNIDFSDSYVVIPLAVVRELEHKSAGTYAQDAGYARMALQYLCDEAEETLISLDGNYRLSALSEPPAAGETKIMLLPVHRHFAKRLPFAPDKDDFAGQTILAALTVTFLLAGLRIDGTELQGVINKVQPNPRVTLLTGDSCLAIRARARGIQTASLKMFFDEK